MTPRNPSPRGWRGHRPVTRGSRSSSRPVRRDAANMFLLPPGVQKRALRPAGDLPLQPGGFDDKRLRGERLDRPCGGHRFAGDVLALRAVRRDLEDRAAEGALGAEATDEGARIDAGESGDAVRAQVRLEIDRPFAARADELADDETFDPWAPALGGALEGPVVTDERVGQDDDLSVVRSVRRDLLIAGHRRVEHDLARRRRSLTERLSPPRGAVLQPEDRRPGHWCITIRFGCIKMQLSFELSDG